MPTVPGQNNGEDFKVAQPEEPEFVGEAPAREPQSEESDIAGWLAKTETHAQTPEAQGTGEIGNWLAGTEEVNRLGVAVTEGQAKATDAAARILRLQAKTGLPEDVVERNADLIEKETAKQDFDPKAFRETSPMVAEWMAKSPNNAAAARNDRDALAKVEKDTRDYLSLSDLYDSLDVGVTKVGAMLHRVPGLVVDFANIPMNQTARMMDDWGLSNIIPKALNAAGLTDIKIPEGPNYNKAPEWMINNRFTEALDERARMVAPPITPSVGAEIARGDWRRAGVGLVHQFVQSAPQQAALLVGMVSGYGIPALIGTGIVTAAEKNAEGRNIPEGVNSPAPDVVATDAVNVGAIEALFENLGTFGILKSWEGAIANQWGKQVSTEVFKDFGKTLFYSAAAEGNEEFWTSIAQDFTDYVTGVNPLAMSGALQRAIDAGLVGSFSGVGLTSPSGIASGVIRQQQVRRAQQTKELYTALGSTWEGMEIRQRLPEAHREIVDKIVKDGPVENIFINPQALEQYFQGKNQNPVTVMQSLGVLDAYEEAKATGGDIKIPLATWADKVVGTEHYQGLADDVKFSPSDLSLNELKAQKAELQAKVEAEAKAGESAPADGLRAAIDEHLGAINYDETTRNQYAQATESRIRTRAAIRGEDPAALWEREKVTIQASSTQSSDSDNILEQGPFETEKEELEFLRKRNLELETELRTSALTGLRNKKAFEEDVASGEWTATVALDMDGLKRLNDTIGHDLADQVLQQLGGFLLKAQGDGSDVRFYHRSGDEFAGLFKVETADAELQMASLQEQLDKLPIALTTRDGYTLSHEGIGVSFGAGKDYEEADLRSNEQKQRRLEEGKREDARSPGKPRRLREVRGRSLREDGGQGDGGSPGSPPPEVLEQEGDKAPRGTYDRIRRAMTLGSGADLSTFLHESGHVWLDEMARDYDFIRASNVTGVFSPEQTQFIQDAEATLKWLGVDSFAKIDRSHHERFAKGVELYFLEGKAPSSSLRDAFARFSAWLIETYRTIRAQYFQGVDLNPAIRGVMDRLVATQEEIAGAQLEQNMAPLFADPRKAGMSEEQAAKYRADVAEATRKAELELNEKVIGQVRREQTKQYRERREAVRKEVADEVNGRPEYIALSVLQHGTLPDGEELSPGQTGGFTAGNLQAVKLSKMAIVAQFGEDRLKRLPKPYVYSRHTGIHPDVAAMMFGFSSGDELLTAIEKAPRRQDLIEQETDRRMKQEVGDLMTDGTMSAEAMKAVHSDSRAQLLQRELELLHELRPSTFKGLARRISRPLPPVEEVRREAEDAIAKKRIRDISPVFYQRAEARAAKEAMDFYLKGDIEAAFAAKEKELLNHELYRAAVTAREEIDSVVEYMQSFGKPSVRERLAKAGADYLQQIDAIADGYDFRKSVSLKAIDKRKSLLNWMQGQQEEGFSVDIPEQILNEANRTHYKDVPYGEILEIRDTVKTIAHLAALKNKLLTRADGRDLLQAKAEIIAAITAHHDVTVDPPDFAPTMKKRFFEKAKGFFAAHTKMEFLFQILDGNQNKGVVWEYLFKPFADAENKEVETMKSVQENLARIFGAYSKKERASWFIKSTFIPEIANSMNKASMIAVALNWGNTYNREALMRGYGWQESQVEAILKNLDARDWDTVQKVWDFIDTFWPDVKQMEEDLNGVAPQKVLAAEVKTPFGVKPGGYYPIIFDSKLSWRQSRLEERTNVQEMFGGNFVKPMTRHGHTKERNDTGGKPLKLELSGLTNHLSQVVHDLTHRRAIIDVVRLANLKDVREVISAAAGVEMYKQINPWLAAIAGERRGEYLNPIEGILGRARGNAAIVNMGLKLTTAITQLSGYTTSVKELGVRYSMAGLQDVWAKPWKYREAWNFAASRSRMMEGRRTNFDRDIKDYAKRTSLKNEVDAAWFSHIGMMDLAVALPTWMGAYRKAMDGGIENIGEADEKSAVDYADQIVRQTQGSGSVKDLALVQRGSEAHRLFTMFYTPFSVLFNQFKKTKAQYGFTKDKAELLFAVSMLWFLPAVMGDLMVGRGPGADDKDKEEWVRWLKWIGKKEITYPFQSIILLRDIINGAAEYGYEPSAAFDAFEGAARTLRLGTNLAIGDKEDITRADVKGLVQSVGYMTGLPSRQVWLTAEYFHDWFTGAVKPANPAVGLWEGLVSGKPKKK